MDRIRVDEPLWDQSTFYGRFRHFYWMTNPLNCMHSASELRDAKILLEKYRAFNEPHGTSREQVKHAMKLYSSSFHPDSGDLQTTAGRMSFQVPGGMVIMGAMVTFYKTVPQVVFLQWVNQTFNALVNYTNRNADSDVSVGRLGGAYVSATASALGVALGLNKVLERSAPPIFRRFVPLLAVAAANCVNIPLMRQTELASGVDLRDEKGRRVCKSKYAARKGIGQVVFSRNVIMAPGMIVLPLAMARLERRAWFARATYLHAPFQVLGIGALLVFMVPFGCALFPQTCEVRTADLSRSDPEAFREAVKKYGGDAEAVPQKLYFNKGL